MISNFIKTLRKKRQWSQDFMAEKLGVSRPTYMQIEQGGRDITISEAKTLADIFEISLEDLLNEREKEPKITIVKDQPSATEKNEIRISVPQRNLKKFKEVFLYILNKIGSKPNVGQSVINKLLYFIDFDYFEKYEEQLIGATYIKNHFGPTPCELIKVLDEMKVKDEIEEVKSHYFKYDQKKFLPRRKPDLSLLSAREKDLIDNVLTRLSDKSAAELKDYSHGDVPWITAKEGGKIDYEAVFYRTGAYSVREYSDDL